MTPSSRGCCVDPAGWSRAHTGARALSRYDPESPGHRGQAVIQERWVSGADLHLGGLGPRVGGVSAAPTVPTVVLPGAVTVHVLRTALGAAPPGLCPSGCFGGGGSRWQLLLWPWVSLLVGGGDFQEGRPGVAGPLSHLPPPTAWPWDTGNPGFTREANSWGWKRWPSKERAHSHGGAASTTSIPAGARGTAKLLGNVLEKEMCILGRIRTITELSLLGAAGI